MRTKTFIEMNNHIEYQDGLEVVVDMPNIYSFEGKIVGIAQRGFVPNYIVECTDGFLPNNSYSFKVVSIPLSYIHPKKS